MCSKNQNISVHVLIDFIELFSEKFKFVFGPANYVKGEDNWPCVVQMAGIPRATIELTIIVTIPKIVLLTFASFVTFKLREICQTSV